MFFNAVSRWMRVVLSRSESGSNVEEQRLVIVAGVFGGLTANRKILYVQALPAAVAFVAVVFSGV